MQVEISIKLNPGGQRLSECFDAMRMDIRSLVLTPGAASQRPYDGKGKCHGHSWYIKKQIAALVPRSGMARDVAGGGAK